MDIEQIICRWDNQCYQVLNSIEKYNSLIKRSIDDAFSVELVFFINWTSRNETRWIQTYAFLFEQC